MAPKKRSKKTSGIEMKKANPTGLPLLLHKTQILLFDMLRNNNIDFILFDPLISDTQCHLHSLLILQTLYKCYNREECFYEPEKLDEIDWTILSYGVLLTLLKIEYVDKFGFVVFNKTITNFNGKLLPTKRKETKLIASLKQTFNLLSVNNIQNLADDHFKGILEECVGSLRHSSLYQKQLPYYGSMHAVIANIKKRNIPIIISLTRVIRTGDDINMKYSVDSNQVFLYKLRDNQFRCVDQLNEVDMNLPAIGFMCFSSIDMNGADMDHKSTFSKYDNYIHGTQFPSNRFLRECDIVHLILMSAAVHVQFSSSNTLKIPPEYDSAENFARDMYIKYSRHEENQTYSLESKFDWQNRNISEMYEKHFRLGSEVNCSDNRYSILQNGKIERSSSNIFFFAKHVFATNYLQITNRIEGYDFRATLDRSELLDGLLDDDSALPKNRIDFLNNLVL